MFNEDGNKILGHCELCGKTVVSYGDVNEEPEYLEHPFNAGTVSLVGELPIIRGNYGSSNFDYYSAYFLDSALRNDVVDKLKKTKKLYICDDCLVETRNTKIKWEDCHLSKDELEKRYMSIGNAV